MRRALITVTLALGLAAPVAAAPLRLADLGTSTIQQLDLDGGILTANTGTSMRAGSVAAGTAFCVGARNGCRRGTAVLSFDTPRAGLEVTTSRLARGSKAFVMLYAGDRLLRRVRANTTQTMSFNLNGVTRVVFSDRSRRTGMVFSVNMPIETVAPTISEVASVAELPPDAPLPVVPVPAGLPLALGALGMLGLVARRRRTA